MSYGVGAGCKRRPPHNTLFSYQDHADPQRPLKRSGPRLDHAALACRRLASANRSSSNRLMCRTASLATACGVIGIVRIDGKDIGSGTEGPRTREIRSRFERLTRGEPK